MGTNGGDFYVHIINLNSQNGPSTENQQISTINAPSNECVLAKHLKLRHAAPVLAVYLTDARGFDVDSRPTTMSPSSPAISDASHLRLVVVSEEQLKVCTKRTYTYKLRIFIVL